MHDIRHRGSSGFECVEHPPKSRRWRGVPPQLDQPSGRQGRKVRTGCWRTIRKRRFNLLGELAGSLGIEDVDRLVTVSPGSEPIMVGPCADRIADMLPQSFVGRLPPQDTGRGVTEGILHQLAYVVVVDE